MAAKKLDVASKYAEYDTDGDGTVTDAEIAKAKEIIATDNHSFFGLGRTSFNKKSCIE